MLKNEKMDGEEIQDAIVIENPEVIENIYTGEIVTIKPGYVFINDVKRAYETISTNGDVFCPVPEDAHFEVGQMVKFTELNPDKERPGKFRTETIMPLGEDSSLAVAEEKVKAVYQLSRTTSPYHQLKKLIAEGDIQKAGENKPLAEFIQQIAWALNQNGGYNPEDVKRLVKEFIEKTFANLAVFDVSQSIIGDIDEATEKAMIDEYIKNYQESGLEGQAESLRREYKLFTKVRKAFTLMNQNSLLNYSSVIDVKHLPEITMAFPVWFTTAKDAIDDFTKEEDPRPDHSVKFFTDCVGSREYAWFYQLYNRRTRPFSMFQGKDIMPPSLVKIMKSAREIFDYVVIMTPYHDVASKEWSDPNWLRNIDPVMVGFLNGLPQMFILGRWSGTGIFPLLLDCIADTANHLRLNKHLTKNFRSNTYWHRGGDGSSSGVLQIVGGKENNHVLPKYVDSLLLAYDRGLVFEFLRGELKDNPEYSFS